MGLALCSQTGAALLVPYVMTVLNTTALETGSVTEYAACLLA